MDEVNWGVNDNFFFNLEDDLQNMQFLSDISNEEEAYHNFIKCLHGNSASKHLVAKSQDKHVSKIWYENLDNDEVSMQINIAFLMHQLKKTNAIYHAQNWKKS